MLPVSFVNHYMSICTMMCSDTKEYPLKLSGYSRVQIPCTLLGCTWTTKSYMYPSQRVHDCGEPKALPPPLKGSLDTTVTHQGRSILQYPIKTTPPYWKWVVIVVCQVRSKLLIAIGVHSTRHGHLRVYCLYNLVQLYVFPSGCALGSTNPIHP